MLELFKVNEDQLSSAKILVVDDQIINLEIVRACLEPHYNITCQAESGKVVEQAVSIQPDLILLDVSMPEIDGLTLCGLLKANEATKHIPVIFLTGLDDSEEACWNAGGADFVQKPVSEVTLFNRVRVQLKLKFYTDNAQLYASIDSLTGVYNRLLFDTQLRATIGHSIRTKAAFGYILIDLDNFKRINDEYGHAFGDRCLKSVAQALRDAAQRPMDVVGRYGGEEFMILLPDTNDAGVVRVAESVLDKIRAIQLKPGPSDDAVYLSASAGVMCAHGTKGMTVESIFSRVDAAMYEAKHNGKDQYVVVN